MKRILILAMALILLCLPSLAEISLIEFAESSVKRISSVNPDADIASIMTGNIYGNIFNTSAGIVRVDDKYNVQSVIFTYDYMNADNFDAFLLMISGISALEYEGWRDSLMAISGKTPMQETINLYKDNMESKILSGLSSANREKPVIIYSTDYQYQLYVEIGEGNIPTGSIRLMAEKIK